MSDCPNHDERCHTHHDREDEHGVQMMNLERQDSIPCACHEDETTTDEAKGGHNFTWWARRKVRGGRAQVEKDVSDSTCECKANKEVTPLSVEHGRYHGILVMRRHHQTQKEDDQTRHSVHACPGMSWASPTLVSVLRTRQCVERLPPSSGQC